MGNEAKVTINGLELTIGQVMSMRVAVGTMIMEMSEPDALGSDEIGKQLANSYIRNLREVEKMLVTGS